MRRELNPAIQMPEQARSRLTALETATETALQARRFVDNQLSAINSQLQYDLEPESVAELKAKRSSLEARRKIDDERFTKLNDRLTAIYRWSDQFVVDCHRKNRVIPPFVAAEVDEDASDPLAWLGIKPGKAVPPKSKAQLRAERARDPEPHPGEHALSYAKRMERLGVRRERSRLEVHPGEQYLAGLQSAMKANNA